MYTCISTEMIGLKMNSSFTITDVFDQRQNDEIESSVIRSLSIQAVNDLCLLYLKITLLQACNIGNHCWA